MTEKRNDQPFLGRLGATAITTVVGGILLGVVLNAYNAPDKLRDKAESDREQSRDEINAAIQSVRGSLSELREQLYIFREGRDFLHQVDWERENRRLEERQAETLRRLETLDERLRHLERQ